jgi:hypothetical protein
LRKSPALIWGAERRLGDWRLTELEGLALLSFVAFVLGGTPGVESGAETLSWREVLRRNGWLDALYR